MNLVGLNLQKLQGTKVGIYIGHNKIGMPDGYPDELQVDSKKSKTKSQHWLSGTAKNMYANLISFAFDFNGPSVVMDTACSSSLTAFDFAVTDLRLGKCDAAIVGTAQFNLQPFTNLIFQINQLNPIDGESKIWDKDADGFVRSEAVVCFLLEKKSEAKRIYATVIHTKTNVDGYKINGPFFPSKELQQKLMEETYSEAGVDPNDIDYFEAHATGTKVGDTEEAEAIYNAYCKDRKNHLLIGLLKSNIGHGEGTSGLASITKAIISFEHKCIAANLYPKTIKPSIAKFCPPFEPVNQTTSFQPNYCAINSFGVGGANAHAIVQANKKEITNQSLLIADKIPRLINFCGRTQDGVDYVFDFIEKNPKKITQDFLALLNEPAKYTQNLNSSGFPYRGSMIIKQKDVNEDGTIDYIYLRETSKMLGLTKPIWLFFSGMGSQWIGMAKALMAIDKFAETINKCAQVLKQFKVDLLNILLSDDEHALHATVKPFIGITAMQIALFDVLKELDIQPDKIIGHSFGEIACAYADGCLNLEQTMLCSYWRGKVVEDSNIPTGKMAAVGLSWEETIKRCPKNVYVACDNAHDTVTISGLEDDVTKFIQRLESENVFVREIFGYKPKPMHTKYLKSIADDMIKKFNNIIPEPKQRSSKWLSTSIPVSNWSNELAQYASAEYFVNNLINPVLFTSTLSLAPNDAIVIEVAPHNLFASLIKRTLKDVNYIGLMKRNNNQQNLEMFISSLGKLYQLGINPSIEKLYPKVEWPVARGTQSISSLIKWDHSESYLVKKYPQYYFPSTASDMTFEFSLDDPDDAFLQDHVIDGNIIFPATGYLMIAWRRLAAQKGLQWNQVPVSFENVQFKRSVQFQNGEVKLTVRYIEPTGEFVILDTGHVAAVGKIFEMKNELININILDCKNKIDYSIFHEDVYKELRVRGYDYGLTFKGIQELQFYDEIGQLIGKVRHMNNSNFIATLDSMIQLMICAKPIKSLFIPVSIQSMKCDPLMFFDEINSIKKYPNKNDEDDTESGTESRSQKWYSDFNVIYNLKLESLITKGIEITTINTANIQRKILPTGLRLETYEFIPYNQDNVIDSYYRNEMLKYLDICSAICKQIHEKYKLKNNIINNLRIKIRQKLVDEMTMNISKDHTLLNILSSVLNDQLDFNNNIELANDLKEKIGKLEFDVSKDIINLVGRNERLIRPLLDTINENINPMKELKVIELNTTNGIIGVDILQNLMETFIIPVAIEYTIAHKQAENESIKGFDKIQDFNIVKWNSDFPELNKNDFNLIIHHDSHELWNINLENYIKSTSKIINENGFLLGIFRSKITTPEIILNDLLYENIPTENQLLNRIEEFEKTAFENGYKIISKKTDSILFTAILFRKINQNLKSNEQTVIEVKTGQFNQWIDQLKQLIEEHKYKDKFSNIWLHAHDSNINGVIGLVQCLRQESGGDKLRCIFDLDNKLPKNINFNLNPFKKILENDLVMNVFKDNKFGSFKHLNLPKNFDQIETTKSFASIMQKGNLSSLQWFDGRNLKNLFLSVAVKEIQQNHVDIYYSSLNFKDVMLASGKIVGGYEESLLDCVLGMEFAGRRRDTGERVYGLSISYGISTEIKTHEPLLLKIPDQWSMEDAATVYAVYMTCWYGLIERGQLQQGETILIHSGAGGVGQAAINTCQYYKCKIFTTVSTQEKREFLKKNFGLTDEQIFSSRGTEFEKKVLQATNGLGVDLVLNSLADDKLLASFRCVGDGGRFIEMGKYDLQMNNPLPMRNFIKNIAFHGISIDKISLLDKKLHLNLVRKYNVWLLNGVENGFIKPLNRTIFKSNELKEAFKYMMTGKHIGKVLIKIRDEEDERKPLKAKPIKMIATTKTWFDHEKVYIIIGGLGGMGLEMVYWMMLKGAQKFVLTSRNGIKTNYQKFFFKQIKKLEKNLDSLKVEIKILTQNVIDENEAENVIDQAESMGKIGGIFQLAMVLHVGLIENQSIDAFDDVCKPKIDATINLDKISRQLPYQIDYFVCFSSITCGRGHIGQTNYGFANSVMERICENRRKDGLHGLAIQWGPIDNIGAAIDTIGKDSFDFTGLQMQRTPSWLYALDKFLQCPYPVVASSIRMEKQFKNKTVEENLMKHLWSSIGVDPKVIPNHVTLGELGIGSVVAVEFQQRLQRDYDINLSMELLKTITAGELREFENGNKDNLKQHSEDFIIAKAKFSKIRFELPNEPITKLNNISSGKPIYLLPPIESIFHQFIPLAKSLPFPVYGLNWTHELEQMKSIKEIGLYYTNLMETIEPNGDYFLLTYNFGSFIALRMAYNKAPVKKIFVIDTLLTKKIDYEDEVRRHELLEEQFSIIKANVSQSLFERMKNYISNNKNEDEKLNKLIESIKIFCPSQNIKDLEVIIKGVAKKAKMMTELKNKYTTKIKLSKTYLEKLKAKIEHKIKAEFVLIKSFKDLEEQESLSENLFQTYGVNKNVRSFIKNVHNFL